MRGEFVAVWSETWEAIWRPLTEKEDIPADIYCELYRELSRAFTKVPSAEDLADIIDNPNQSRQAFINTCKSEFSSENALVKFFESTYDVLDELKGEELANHYIFLLVEFIDKYNLGYSFRPPCFLSPNLSGMFTNISTALKELCAGDTHIAELFKAHEEAIKDLRFGASEERIKTCISKQFMLLEAVASNSEGANAGTLGAICDKVQSWPHNTVRDSLKKLYGFASDFPGIRHAGNPSGKLRNIDARDLAAFSIVLTGYTVYLTSDLKTKLGSLIPN